MSIVADLILNNANVITCEPSRPGAEAIATKGDRILLVGANQGMDQVKGPDTRIIDCQGRTLVPGFNDAHCHFYPIVRKLFSLDLSPSDIHSIEDIKKLIRRKVRFTPEGLWISGTDYNEFYLAEKRHPTRWDLDEVAPRNPVMLAHRSLHAAVLNSLALKMVGIDRETEEPQGGIIERELDSGEPNGVLYEMGDYLRSKVRFSISDEELEWGVSEINREFLSHGITSIGEASITNDLAQWQAYLKLKKYGKLAIRVYMMAGTEFLDEFENAGIATGFGDAELKVGSLKIMLSEATGKLNPPQKELNQKVLKASQAGFQVAIHAVEQSVVEAAVSALEYAQKQHMRAGLRHRIEHGSECPPEIISRLNNLKAVVVSQPPFIYYSGDRYLSQVSPEAQQCLYPFKSLIDNGIIVAGSSDSPVVPYNPLVGIYAAVARRTESGQIMLPGETISLEHALALYTLNAAYAALEERIKGTLVPGKLADIVMLSADPFHAHVEMIKDIHVEMTIVGGNVLYEKSENR